MHKTSIYDGPQDKLNRGSSMRKIGNNNLGRKEFTIIMMETSLQALVSFKVLSSENQCCGLKKFTSHLIIHFRIPHEIEPGLKDVMLVLHMSLPKETLWLRKQQRNL